MAPLILIGILIALIVVHELGHFIAAKLFRVEVLEFGVGYPPRALSLGTFGGTTYSLNWLPFGGFVRLLEEDGPESVRGKRNSFGKAPRISQGVILAAGVLMNVLAGWMLFSAGLMYGMPRSVSPETEGARLIISSIVPGSPAEAAGLASGDVITGMTESRAAAVLSPEGVASFVSSHGGKELTVTYVRGDSEPKEVTVVPAHAVIPGVAARPAIGVDLAMIAFEKLPFTKALTEGAFTAYQTLGNVFSGIAQLVVNACKGTADMRSLVGPVGLSGAVGDAASQGKGQLLGLAAFISLNLAVINLIPIPALDGGRLLFVIVEGITRRRVPTIVTQLLNAFGFVGITLLMLVVTYHDIARLVG
jgi:regulator of sigma E protease